MENYDAQSDGGICLSRSGHGAETGLLARLEWMYFGLLIGQIQVLSWLVCRGGTETTWPGAAVPDIEEAVVSTWIAEVAELGADRDFTEKRIMMVSICISTSQIDVVWMSVVPVQQLSRWDGSSWHRLMKRWVEPWLNAVAAGQNKTGGQYKV